MFPLAILKQIQSVLRIIPFFFLFIVLTNCGGGGGSSKDTGDSGDGGTGDGGDGGDNSGGGGNTGQDPLFADQWHLKNTGQKGGTVGEDINVEKVWGSYTGSGVRVAVIDSDLQITHEDLQSNMEAGQSHNYLDGSSDPTGPTDGLSGLGHGTSVAGIIGAVGFNEIGVRGVAPNVSLVGYNLIATGGSLAANEADAMVRGKPVTDVYSNSWGAADSTGLLQPSSNNWQTAINDGLVNGRNALGAIYTWAAGNGGSPRFNLSENQAVDNSNYDGRANYFGVMAVVAVNDKGTRSSYSERGANVLISAPGGEFCDTHTITTVDRTGSDGFNTGTDAADYADGNYTQCFNGTSSATPVVSGVIALMLQANPNLTWRDVRIILARTARKNDPSDVDWLLNSANLPINHQYGFGVIDAEAAVNAASGWTNVSQQFVGSVSSEPNIAIIDGPGDSQFGQPITDTINISTSESIKTIEFIAIDVTSDHTFIGDLEISLTSPGGTVSRLTDQHLCFNLDSPPQQINCEASLSSGFRFGSVRHLDESVLGEWKLSIRDGFNQDTGTLQSWRLTFYGR